MEDLKISDFLDNEEVKDIFQAAIVSMANKKLEEWIKSEHGISNLAVWFVSAFQAQAVIGFREEVFSKVEQKVKDPSTYDYVKYNDEFKRLVDRSIHESYPIIEARIQEKIGSDDMYEDINYNIGSAITEKLFKMIKAA